MAVEAANIGANFSNYVGNPNLGGGSLGAFVLDTRPLQDFARYTMLYNREEQARKQREAEKAAEELGKIADYDLTTSIPKDAKVLQEKYDKLISYVKENPGSLQFKNRDQWIEYQRRKNELANDIRGAKVRNVLNMAREKEIADAKDEIDKKRMREELDSEIQSKDIRTPIFFTQQYDIEVPNFEANKGQSILVNRFLPNQIIQDTVEIFDAAEADRSGAAMALGVDFDETTTTGKIKRQKFGQNFYVKGRDILNQAIDNAKAGIDPALDKTEQEKIIRGKLSGIGIASAIEDYNQYVSDIQKRFTNKELSGNGVNPDAYSPINWSDGVTDIELAKVVQYLTWKGDKKESKIIQTNDAIERARIGLGYANLDLERQRQLSSKTEDWISADAVVREVQDAIKMATPLDILFDGKVVRQVRQIADPNLLKEFGNIDKDGKTTNIPDVVIYDPKDNQLSLVYHKKDEQGVVQKGQTGNIEIDREVKLNPTQWIGQITKRKNPNKDIGGVNAIVEQIYTRNGRNLVELANNYGGQGAVGTTKTTTTQSSSSTELSEDPADWKKEGNNWRYKDGRLYDSKGNLIKQ